MAHSSERGEGRPDPDALVRAAAREHHGRLKVFLGAAPGVGKTWEMLTAAGRRRDEGADVVAGIIETHGRAETEAQLGTLPVLPRRQVAYRGQSLEEFDLDAALARRPGLLLVDELAHTNAPGSRHNKRWEDVAELLEAGIDVWATLNVQHLESLNDAVARVTGVRVAETLPDRVLETADQIELVDLPPDELRRRLEEGRIYRPDVARRALDGFFREGNLTALREIALRRAAEHVDSDVQDFMRANAIQGPFPAGERVLALIGPDAASDAVVRHAKRLADALRAPWIALHVERPDGNPDARPPMALAAALGAELETRAGHDLVGTALALARARNVTQIVIGRARPARWRRVLGRTLAAALLREAADFALHVVPGAAGGPGPRRRRAPVPWLAWAAAPLLVALVTAAGMAAGGVVPHEAMGMLYLAAAVAVATASGVRPALLTASLGFLAWNFFLIPPRYTFTIDSARDGIAIVVFLGVAVATGTLAGRVRAEAQVAQARIVGLRRIAAFSRKLGEASTEAELLAEIARQASGIAGEAVVLVDHSERAAGGGGGAGLALEAASSPEAALDDGGLAAAQWCFDHQEAAGRGTATLPMAAWAFLPLRTVRQNLGVLGVRPAGGPAGGARGGEALGLDQPQAQALSTLADQAAVALERVRLANQAARAAAQAETQKLRTALLNSLSHDLRTPLTGIRGAAGTLRTGWDRLPAPERLDLLASIEQDTVRMTGFLSNITDMTRLESGEIVPRRERVPLEAAIEAAIARVPGIANTTTVNLAEGLPAALADPALLEQVLVNVLDNAAKYGPQGGFIRVRGTAASGEIRLEVADEGVGIAAEDLPHVFDSFYRARREDRARAGTGLGLAIARGLVQAMGGGISAQSPRLDRARDAAPGTVVSIVLPAAIPGRQETRLQGTA